MDVQTTTAPGVIVFQSVKFVMFAEIATMFGDNKEVKPVSKVKIDPEKKKTRNISSTAAYLFTFSCAT